MGLEITQGGPHKNRVGLLQGPPKNEGKSMLPLSWLWSHGGELLVEKQRSFEFSELNKEMAVW